MEHVSLTNDIRISITRQMENQMALIEVGGKIAILYA